MAPMSWKLDGGIIIPTTVLCIYVLAINDQTLVKARMCKGYGIPNLVIEACYILSPFLSPKPSVSCRWTPAGTTAIYQERTVKNSNKFKHLILLPIVSFPYTSG